ncbi:MAG: glycogen debranching enzyme, partial [Proteobacteria bacterium]|nr:glycogen debranching enzyme [Pseudomonadota bacterium]
MFSDNSGNPRQWSRKPGKPLPLGATITPEGINFSVFSRNATSVTLVIFEKARQEPVTEISLDPAINKTGDIWHILVVGIDTSCRYGYRADGPFDPKGKEHWFNKENILLDPYARALQGGETWGRYPPSDASQVREDASFERRCLIPADDFDWEGDRPLNLPLKDSVIYELHV